MTDSSLKKIERGACLYDARCSVDVVGAVRQSSLDPSTWEAGRFASTSHAPRIPTKSLNANAPGVGAS
jgi:hypothetical protein